MHQPIVNRTRAGSKTLGIVLLALAAAFAGGLDAAADDAAPGKLNVLFLISDDLRPELGCYGHPHVKTPNIDDLAARGVRFDRAYCQYPLCNPSRSSMLNGRYPVVTGVLDNRAWFGAAHPDYVSLPKLFKQNGYATLRSGKIFHGGIDDSEAWTEGGEPRTLPGVARDGNPDPPPARKAAPGSQPDRKGETAAQIRARRSDQIVVIPGDGESVGDGAVAGRAIDQLRRHKDGPFFLACGFSKPHSPPSAPKRFFDMYDPSEVVLPPDFAPRPTAPVGIPPVSVRKNTDLFIGREATPDAAREVTRAYWASLTWMDHNVGRVVSELDRLGLREKTVIVFWGDHGYHLGEKGRWSKAGSLFETGTRVPLIVVAPGAKGNGHASPRVVESLDLYRTLAELAGLAVPDGVRGHSLAPLLADPTARRDYPAYSVWAETGTVNGVAVRTEKYRYAEWTGEKGGPMLFDLEADPHELKNLADDPSYAAVRRELSELVRRHMTEK